MASFRDAFAPARPSPTKACLQSTHNRLQESREGSVFYEREKRPMLRRMEMYKIRSDVPKHVVSQLEGILLNCQNFVPQLRHSVVARNMSDVDVTIIWEHAFDSAEAYDIYVAHPYHACILDRYLFPDSPEVVTEQVMGENNLGIGLLGYEIDGAEYYRESGIRRIVLLRIDRGATPAEVEAQLDVLRAAAGRLPELAVSIFASNKMGLEWFDQWTHVWEQAFGDEDAMTTYLEGRSELALAEKAGWRSPLTPLIERSLAIHYRLRKPGPEERST
jgi:hypothetical protein